MEDVQSRALPVNAGDVVAGKYRIERVLGAGGMGIVVCARHLQLDDRVAIKLVHPEVVSNREVRERFLREARAAVRVKSEHVARVIDVGELPGGAPFMVLEYLEGESLDTTLASQGPLPLPTTVDYILQACEAIAEAHALGIVHRDLKPANLFLTRRADGSSCVKVLDFGISKETAPEAPSLSLTRTQQVLGSPYYMSPEQLTSSRSVDARSDVWALGVVLFELLTGTLPFSGETTAALAVEITTAEPASVRARRPELPPGIEAAIRGCLEKDREKRHASVAALARALAPFAPPGARSSIERILRTLGGEPAADAAAAGRPRRRRGALAAGALALLVAGAAAARWRKRETPEPPAGPGRAAGPAPAPASAPASAPTLEPVPDPPPAPAAAAARGQGAGGEERPPEEAAGARASRPARPGPTRRTPPRARSTDGVRNPLDLKLK